MKYITIKRNGTARNFAASKLRIKNQGGGSSDWVPEDEVQLIEKTITKEGTYEAADDDAYGYSKVTVSGLKPDKDTKLTSKSISQNGVYTAKNEGFYGYSSVNVHVRGSGTYTDPSTGQTYTPDPSPDTGSMISGIDPDGNEELVKVDDGKLKKLKLASEIKLDTPPDKIAYSDGERIFMTGAVVRGYLNDGMPYKNQSYKDSILPWRQDDVPDEIYSNDFLPGGIVFNMPLYADISKGEGGEKGEYYANVDGGIAVFKKIEINIESGSYFYSEAVCKRKSVGEEGRFRASKNATVYATYYNDVVYFLSDSEITVRLTPLSSTGYWRQYAMTGISRASVLDESDFNWYISESPENPTGVVTSELIEKSSDIKQTITLTWPREGDRKHLQTTFEITVTES